MTLFTVMVVRLGLWILKQAEVEVIEVGINGSVVENPSDINAIAAAIEYWRNRPDARPISVKADLSLERNVKETLTVLELAAAEKAA